MSNKKICGRRVFLKKITGGAVAIGTLGGLNFLSSCSKNGISPFAQHYIDTDSCTGCGDCLEKCYYDAIMLPQRSIYSINADKCIECGKCVEYCEENAIKVSVIDYHVVESNCVGCGDCIEVCADEGNCIEYEKDYYSVRNKCRHQRCHQQCVMVCPEDAITVGDIANIDMEKCTLCGECIDACPVDAINPARVKINDADCTHCGKCYEECEWDAIERIEPDNYAPPHIDMDICTSCADCIESCPEEYDAIERELFTAEIDRKLCTDCGECIDSCEFDSILLKNI